jgi:bacillolysin
LGNARDQKDPAKWIYFMDAIDGGVIYRYNDIIRAGRSIGYGVGYYSGTGDVNTYDCGNGYYQLRDVTRKDWTPIQGPEIRIYDGFYFEPSIIEDNDNKWEYDWGHRHQNQRAEVDAIKFAGCVADYFRLMHLRVSYDNAENDPMKKTGANIDIHVHEPSMQGAWDNDLKLIYIGDGDGSTEDFFSALDVIAHEFTHGVTKHCFDYIVGGESGAVGEAISDCFAALIFIWITNGQLEGAWLMGEEVWLKKDVAPAFLNLANPTNGGKYDRANAINSFYQGNTADHYSDRYITESLPAKSNDYGGIHINGTILSHAIYLMTVGGTHRKSGVSVAGIGPGAVGKILYYTQN